MPPPTGSNGLRGQQMATEAALAAAEAAAGEAEAAWRALWQPSGLQPLAPPAMAEWRREREEVLRLVAAAAERRRERDELATRRDRVQAELAALLPAGPDGKTLAGLLRRAETECAAAEAAARDHQARRKELADAEAGLPELRAAVDAAAAALARWREGWATAVPALGLGAAADIAAAEGALDAWARIAETVPAWQADEQRIADMSAAVEGFAAAALAAQAGLDEPPTGEPALVTAARLARRLAGARQAAAAAAGLAQRMETHEKAAGEARRRRDDAEAELEALRRLAGADDDGALEQAIGRAARRDALAGTIAQLEHALLAQGDGIEEATLSAEAGGIGADAVVGHLAEIEAGLAELGRGLAELSAERTRAEATLAAMQAGHDAAEAAQRAEDALAEARAAAERYARLHVTQVLLRAGIERFRREQQGPLLQAGGAHFALLTAGRYARLAVDHDAAGQPVLIAVRDNGSECPMAALSDGTRDQLYLALRVAAVEAHAARAEPLPFVADDLLVNFDDLRAAAALDLLARLGSATQVILFTHHRHVAELAGGRDGVAVLELPDAA